MRALSRKLWLLTTLLIPQAAYAQDCQGLLRSFLDREPALSSIYVVMTTLNLKNVVSYSETRLYYLPAHRMPGGRIAPGRFATLPANSQGVDQPKYDFGSHVQVFSDRMTNQPLIGTFVGLPHHGRQKFDEHQADDLGLEFTDTSPMQVTVTLRTWGNVKETFTPVCESSGFIYGSTSVGKYLLRVSKWPPPP